MRLLVVSVVIAAAVAGCSASSNATPPPTAAGLASSAPVTASVAPTPTIAPTPEPTTTPEPTPDLASISGTITDPSGSPVVGSSVLVGPSGSGSYGDYRDTTTADGTYRVEGFPAGKYCLMVDLAITREEHLTLLFGPSGWSIKEDGKNCVTVGQTPAVVDLVIPERLVITGKVADGKGAPIARAEVRAGPSRPNEEISITYVNDQGEFELAVVPGTWQVQFIANAEHFVTKTYTISTKSMTGIKVTVP